jgi:hypothetical protein
VQLRNATTSRRIRLDHIAFLERGKHHLGFGDLGHLRRWRETFECRRKDCVGFGGAASGLVEFRERKGGTEFEAARPLLARDFDGSSEGFLARSYVVRTKL